MRVTRKSRMQIRLQNLIFYILFLALVGVVAWLSTEYVYKADWTYSHRNSLHQASIKLLATLDKPLQFTDFASDDKDLHRNIANVINKYKAIKPDTTLDFVNPVTDPEAARNKNIKVNGELVVGYGGRSENLTDISERTISSAIERLARASTEYVVFVTGDGERSPDDKRNFDLDIFASQLKAKGFKIEMLDLATKSSVPQNTALLVIAGPQVKLTPSSVAVVTDYVKRDGNLLWLGDPGGTFGLDPLAASLGIHFANGTIINPDYSLLGTNDPRVIQVTDYSKESPITHDFDVRTLFVSATSVYVQKNSRWHATVLLQTPTSNWLQTGQLSSVINMNPKQGDKRGPLPIGVALTRKMVPDVVKQTSIGKSVEQRVVVMGDGDFLSNALLENGGNLTLGLNIFDWLTHSDTYIDINPQSAPDRTLNLSMVESAVIATMFLFALPLLLVFLGVVIWIRRRRR
ncbi:MAG: GldG family protein [Gammaproteobacteria bacterium]